MSIRFELLLSLTASHVGLARSVPELDFVMPRDTVRAVQNGMLLVRVRDRRLQVLYEADADGAPILGVPGTRLRFGFKPSDPSFLDVTTLGFDPHLKTALYRNASQPLELDPLTPVCLVGALLSHRITEAARPVTLRLSDAAGTVLWTETVTHDDAYAMVPFHLMRLPVGRYSLEESYPMSRKNVAYYVDPELLSEGVLGIVELDVSTPFYSSAPSFGIAFDAKQRVLVPGFRNHGTVWRGRSARAARPS